MQKIKPGEPATRSADVVAENVARLKALFPEAVTEGELDFDVLKQVLGGAVDEREEKYGLNWHGKRRARQLALTPSSGTLRPCPEESVEWAATQNIVIEGDNLEVLKLLQKSYAGKVKMIYIDPPYNTGSDFVYPDDFRDNIQNYLKLTGQVDDGGKKVSANPESSGRFHTDWLNMLYPRLKLARNLLNDDGLIFISIDDNEIQNLRLAMDDVFGPENYLATIHIQVRYEGKTLVEDSDFQKLLEHVVVYRKSESGKLNKKTEEYSLEKFEWAVVETGTPKLIHLGNKDVSLFSPGQYEIRRVPPSTSGLKEIWASGKVLDGNSSGRFFRDYLEGRVAEDGLGALYKVADIGDDGHGHRYFTGPLRIGATKGKYYQGVPQDRLSATSNTKETPIPCFLDFADSFGNCRHEGGVDFRSGKKPLAFLRQLLEFGTKPGSSDRVLDFFAGSGTTGHAVLEANFDDGGQRRFVLVQLPEPMEGGEFRTIAELTQERLRRAGKKIKSENSMFAGDLGFRVFKLASSNIRAWEPDRENLAQTLLDAVEHLKTDRTEQDILYELLLKLGLDLTVPIETKTIAGKAVHSVGAGALLVCLAENIEAKAVEPLALGIAAWHTEQGTAGECTAVFRDSAFADDIAKTNLTTILEQHGLEKVRSL